MQSLTELVDRLLPGPSFPARLVVVVGLFLAAWAVKRLSGIVAGFLVDRGHRRRGDHADTAVITSLRQRETAITLVQTSIGYVAFGLALVLAIATLAGARRVETVVGASFLAVLLAFAFQRFLMDVIAGLLMFFEGWFRVGDTVRIEPWGVEGVIERATLRSVAVRSVDGQLQHMPNSTVGVVKLIPRGYREFEAELFVSDRDAGRELVERIGGILPTGATNVVRRPRLVETEELDADLHRLAVRLAVAPGREWLAESLFPDLLKERAGEGLLVHGPIVLPVDEQASRRFARAVWTSTGSRRGADALADVRRLREASRRGETRDYP